VLHAEHTGHHHHHPPSGALADAGEERRVLSVLLLTGGFMIAQAIGGWWSGSLALIADSGHMLSDTAALALAWVGFRVGRRPSDAKRSYGYHRFQILAAFSNGLALFAVAAWIVVEAISRLRAPGVVLGLPMLAVAVLGFAVNLTTFLVLRRGNSANLNIRAALLHVLGDLLTSVGAIVAALVILTTGWTPIDPILSALIAVLILRGAWDITRRAGHVLMEGVPEGFEAATLREDLMTHVAGVRSVHHVHAWLISAERPMVTLHLELEPGADAARVLPAVKARLRDSYGFGHSTIQIEQGDCPD
jgi:cobalt-zinc-cadmium efflux system protein